MRVLGIDPGLSGALALLDIRVTRSTPTLEFSDMPAARQGRNKRRTLIEAALAQIVRDMRPEHAIIELVHSMPAQGVASTFSFGNAYGAVRGILAALDIPVTTVTPQKWHALVQIAPGRGDDAGRVRAAELFPAYARDFVRRKKDGRADAALIALAGFRLISPF